MVRDNLLNILLLSSYIIDRVIRKMCDFNITVVYSTKVICAISLLFILAQILIVLNKNDSS